MLSKHCEEGVASCLIDNWCVDTSEILDFAGVLRINISMYFNV